VAVEPANFDTWFEKAIGGDDRDDADSIGEDENVPEKLAEVVRGMRPLVTDIDLLLDTASESDPLRDMLLVGTVVKYPEVVNRVKSSCDSNTTLQGFFAICPEDVNIDRLRCRQSACGGLAIIECFVVLFDRTGVNSIGA
jgi:hypothetical protein